MILRTPPQRKRRADSVLDNESPVSDRRLVPYTEPVPVSCHDPSDQMACTYHCRQMVKSEFLDAFSTAEKQVIDYRSQLEVLNKDLFTSEEERKKFWEQLCFAEQELAASRGREQALQERLLKEVTDSQERYRMQVKRCSELEVQLKKEVDVRKKAEASAAKQKAMDLDRELICLSERSEREKSRLQKELLHLQDVEKLSHSRLNSDLERMRVRADNAAKESELLKKQMEDLREQLNECLLQKSEVEHKLSSLTVPTSEVTPKESETLVRHLQEELRKYEVEVREARKFKSSQGDLLLKEKLLEEKVHREKAEAELSKLQEVQLNADKLEHELMAWKSLVKEIPGVSSLGDIPTKFAGMQKEVLDSMTKVVEVSAHLKDLEQALELANIGRQHAETDSALAKEKAEELALEVKRLTLALELNTKERDRLRKDGVMWNKLKSGHLESGTANESLLKDLESSLAQRGSTIKELESNLREQREVIDRQHNELRLMNEKLNAEATKIKFLEREGDRLRSDISVLESKLGHGDYSAANTKVLRMVNTLAVDNEVKHTIEALRAELQKAQAKLQAVEELKGQSDAGSLIDSQISDKLAQLKGQIATLEKREERYKAVFAEKISVFRRACCSLFGYKIVMDDQQRPNGIPMTRFTLQSIYAQSDDEKLEFEYESGNTNILVNDYTSQREISQQVEIFIRKMNSIPAFTANLTVESFNKRTLS